MVNAYRHERAVAALPAGTPVARPGGGRSYYVGQVLRCRKYKRFGRKGRLSVNNNYTVVALGDAGARVRETGGEERELTWAVLRDHFSYALAHTCHSLQGMSVSDGITLFDVDFFYVTREWFYTAPGSYTHLTPPSTRHL